jgi:hypothetical protein
LVYADRVEDDEIRELVTRLARPHASGGDVVERAAILAEGHDFTAVMSWITAHDGEPEELVVATRSGGLHGGRFGERSASPPSTPRRFVLPAGALS